MTILVGYRPTHEGTAALDHAIDETARRSTELLILHSSEAVDTSTRQSLEQQVDALASRLEGTIRGARIQLIDPDTDPADAILDAAAETEAELIVVGIRRRSPIGKLVLGSTAQRVLLEADCPVLAVKTRTSTPAANRPHLTSV